MSPRSWTPLRRALLARREELAPRAATPALEGDGNGHDYLDIAQASIRRDEAVLTQTRARLELEAIDQALARLDAGTFGLCTECGERIGDKRLAVLLTVQTCFGCAERAEREEKRMPRSGPTPYPADELEC